MTNPGGDMHDAQNRPPMWSPPGPIPPSDQPNSKSSGSGRAANATIIAAVISMVGGIVVAVIGIFFRPDPTPGPKPGPTIVTTTHPTGGHTTNDTQPPDLSSSQPQAINPVFWNGPINLTKQGTNFDTNPPSVANGKGVYYNRRESPLSTAPVIQGAGGTLFARSTSMSTTTKETCSDDIQANGQPNIAYYFLGAPGDFCFRTSSGRIGTITFTNDGQTWSPVTLQVSVVVWN